MKLIWTTALILSQLGGGSWLWAQARGGDHWVVTWATAELLSRSVLSAASASPTAPGGFHDQTVRMMVRASMSGQRLRVKLENAFGNQPVEIGAAHIALRGKDSAIVEGSDHALAFDGKPGCTLGPGMVLVSDPVDLSIEPLADLAVSLYFPGDTGAPTNHSTGLHDTYVKEGNVAAAPSMADATITHSYYWLSAIDVEAPASAGAIVAYGDSITDGARSNNETNHSWPALLAARLAAKKDTARIGVANEGIGGNRLLHDGTGASALARLDRDVFSLSGVKWLMVLEGINDIGHMASNSDQAVTADDLIAADRQIIDQAHAHGILVIGCTLTPYEGAGYSREAGEAMREALNNWIRTGGAYDAVVDFEAATRDPQNPKRYRPEFDPGDHLHPNDTGYQAMADAVDLGIFTGKPKVKAKH
ncbi:MAG TPA: SGNH/GDSL hydrolase family protein [Bryobacteraceae bacterium]|nr:SGNH/GDSL hydrolase family protein [Bryobacteraceae bacterium]